MLEPKEFEQGECMSSKLSRAKRKKKPNYGWMQSEIDAIGEYQSRIKWIT